MCIEEMLHIVPVTELIKCGVSMENAVSNHYNIPASLKPGAQTPPPL